MTKFYVTPLILTYSGATHSTLVLLSSEGKIISQTRGPGTNHFLIGMPECRKRIANMVNAAKLAIQIPQDVPLAALVSCTFFCNRNKCLGYGSHFHLRTRLCFSNVFLCVVVISHPVLHSMSVVEQMLCVGGFCIVVGEFLEVCSCLVIKKIE